MKKALSLLLISSYLFSAQLTRKSNSCPTVGKINITKSVEILYGQEGFYILQDNQDSKIQKKFVVKDVEKVFINPNVVFYSNDLGSLELYYGKKNFYVLRNDKKIRIEKSNTDPVLRNISKQQLFAFLQHGHLSVNQMENGEFNLIARSFLKSEK